MFNCPSCNKRYFFKKSCTNLQCLKDKQKTSNRIVSKDFAAKRTDEYTSNHIIPASYDNYSSYRPYHDPFTNDGCRSIDVSPSTDCGSSSYDSGSCSSSSSCD